jgi:hypothetical protein
MATTMPEALPARWKERAEYLRRCGDSNTARLWTFAADELEAALKVSGEESLSLRTGQTNDPASLKGWLPTRYQAAQGESGRRLEALVAGERNGWRERSHLAHIVTDLAVQLALGGDIREAR